MTDPLTTGVSVAYALLVVLSLFLLAASLRSRRPGTPGHRPLLLSLGMSCFALQGLLLIGVALWGGLPLLTFVFYGAVLEVAGVAFFLGAALR